jgi:hypothetical protein
LTKYFFTSDIDWAPEEVIEDTLALFAKYDAKITLFATHKSEQILNSDRNYVEVGIHPNFNGIMFKGDSQRPEKILNELLAFYPEAIGVRCHSVMQSSGLVNLFRSFGMLYESNTFLPYCTSIKPYKCWTGITRIPYNWEDDVHFTYGYDFNSDNLAKNCEFKIYDFHPIHIFLNTDIEETYLKAKDYNEDFEKLNNSVNRTKVGVRDLLISILEEISDSHSETYFMRDLIIK